MRPFKFFFGLSIAVILLFFVARVLIIAFFVAALLSLPFIIFRKLRGAAHRHRRWHRDYDREDDDFFTFPDEDENERLILDWEPKYERVRKARIIRVD